MDLDPVKDRTPRRIRTLDREAAVLVPLLYREGEPWLLFTKRADHLGEHPGQMSFPGGGREPGDVDLRTTATREANEEIGLRPHEVDFAGRLDDIRTVTGYAVSPFVSRIPDREYRPDQKEVAEIVVLKFDDFLLPDNHEIDRRNHPDYGEIVVHYFNINGYTVWGATGRIVVQFLELTTDWQAPERLDPEHYL